MQENPDNQHSVPMVEELERELGDLLAKLLADAGYFSESQIRSVETKGMAVHCPPDPWRVTESSPCPRERPSLGEQFKHSSDAWFAVVENGGVSVAEGQCRTGLRFDQAGARAAAVPPSREDQGRSGVGTLVPAP